MKSLLEMFHLAPAQAEVHIGNTELLIHNFLVLPWYRLYEGALVHHLAQQMTSGKVKNFLEKDIPVAEEYKKMLTIIRQFYCWQPRRRRTGRHRHPQVNMAVDPEQLYDPEEEAAAVRALRDLDLEHRVPPRARHTRQVLQKKKYSLPTYPVFVVKDFCRDEGDFVL